jgi:hypothetical protein
LISFKTITVNTNRQPDELLSLLTWKIHQVDNLLLAKTNSFTANTTRPLIGTVDNNKRQFNLTRLRPLLQIYMPQLLVKGQITRIEDTTTLILKYRLGLFTTAVFLFLIYGTGHIIWQVINSLNNQEVIWSGLVWLLVFPAIAVLLISWELTKTTDTILDILELENK